MGKHHRRTSPPVSMSRGGLDANARGAKPQMLHRNIVVLGFRGVGKSAVTGRFVGDDFYEHYNPTIETTKSKRLKTSRGHDTTVDVIDLAGMDQTNEIRQNLIFSAHGYLLMYTITSENSFQMIEQINNRLLVQCGDDQVPRVLVANMVDLTGSRRKVSDERSRELADKLGIRLFETSAKTGKGINEAFTWLLDEIDNRRQGPVIADLPNEEIQCHPAGCEASELCCCFGDDDDSNLSQNCTFMAVASQLLMGAVFLFIIFVLPSCPSDSEHRVWQNYYLLLAGVLDCFAGVMMVVAIQENRPKMVRGVLLYMSFMALSTTVVAALSLYKPSPERCSDRIHAIGYFLLATLVIQLSSIFVLYHRNSEEGTPHATFISTTNERTTGRSAAIRQSYTASFLGHSSGDLGDSWQSNSILGSRTNGQNWSRATNASNNSFLHRPLAQPPRHGAAQPPSARIETFAQPLYG